MFGIQLQHAVFPNSYAGIHLAFLFIPSPALSFLAFILTKPMGTTSLYLIPAAYILTSINHIVTYGLLSRKPRVTTDVNSPSEARFGCLRHLANICIEGFTAALWLAGGLTSIVVNVSKWSNKNSPQDVAAASLAILEAGLMATITAYCWKLRKEARLSSATPDVVIVDTESVALMSHAKTNV
ncbi:hypothetical protein B0J17DRAFT_769782 [Rhizoctonia solani]|nr:hypothetical protein B0J17DRAFT_769782 [Rhizoctonia solani]